MNYSPSFKQIVYGVVAAHLILLVWIGKGHPTKVKKPSLQIQRVVFAPNPLSSSREQLANTSTPPKEKIKKSPPPKAKTQLPPKKSIPSKLQPIKQPAVEKKKGPPPPPAQRPVVEKKPIAPPKPTPLAKKSPAPLKPPPIQVPLQGEKEIAKIAQKEDKRAALFPEAPSQQKVEDIQGGFVSSLVSCLQGALDLPSIGAVKVRLTLQANGSCTQVEILESESHVNEVWLERELKELPYPPFGEELKNEKEHTFVITFTNRS